MFLLGLFDVREGLQLVLWPEVQLVGLPILMKIDHYLAYGTEERSGYIYNASTIFYNVK